MHDSLRTQLSELADYASGSARLDTPAAVRQHGTRRGRRRRSGAALLGVGVVAAVGAVVGIAHPGVTGPDTARAPASSASSAQLTAYQTTVLAKAHLTKAQVAALARSGFTTAQISALAAATAQLTQQREERGHDRPDRFGLSGPLLHAGRGAALLGATGRSRRR